MATNHSDLYSATLPKLDFEGVGVSTSLKAYNFVSMYKRRSVLTIVAILSIGGGISIKDPPRFGPKSVGTQMLLSYDQRIA